MRPARSLSLPAAVILRRAGRRAVVLVSLAALPAGALADTGDTLSGYVLCALLTILVGLGLLYGAVLIHRWMTSSQAPLSPSSPLLIPAAAGQSPFDFRLLDVVELAADITVYFVKLGRRVLLLASRDGSLVSLGDFPLAWAFGDEPEQDAPTFGPRSRSAVTPAPGGLLLAARGRDERQWEEQRRALIQSLQQEEA